MRSPTKRSRSLPRSRRPRPEARQYPAVIAWSAHDDCFVASVPALRGCMSHGSTPEEAAHNILEAARGWLQTARRKGLPIPPPPRGMSGRMLVRIPRTLHEDVTRRAELDGVSLNQWVTAALAEKVAR
ncbi:MAG: type II toxin-antitoxin system HicB family antitoxin [Deltaproteobacteria bacterium]|nr:type II toxin-antitoxin system HicB family antitoxin [Deltaproteobacteria bacterium]